MKRKQSFLTRSSPLPKSLSQAGRGTLKGFPAPLSCLGEGVGERARILRSTEPTRSLKPQRQFLLNRVSVGQIDAFVVQQPLFAL
jgi:hypothetical protein